MLKAILKGTINLVTNSTFTVLHRYSLSVFQPAFSISINLTLPADLLKRNLANGRIHVDVKARSIYLLQKSIACLALIQS